MGLVDLAATTLAGVLFGLALAAPPGPMNAIIAEESVLRGWFAGFRAGLGAMTADVCFFLLALAGFVAAIEELPRLRAGMVLLGGLLMWYFAIGAASGARSTLVPAGDGADDGPGDGAADGPGDVAADGPGDVADDGANVASGEATGKGFRKAFVLALTNPYQILFWLTVGVGLLAPGRLDVLAHTPYAGEALAGTIIVRTGTPALLFGLFAGIAVWIVAFPATLVAARRRIDALAPVVAGLSALVLGGFGTVFLVDGLGTLL